MMAVGRCWPSEATQGQMDTPVMIVTGGWYTGSFLKGVITDGFFPLQLVIDDSSKLNYVQI
jgi:hypothetical protein